MHIGGIETLFGSEAFMSLSHGITFRAPPLPSNSRGSNRERDDARHEQRGYRRVTPAPAPGALGARDGACANRFIAEEAA